MSIVRLTAIVPLELVEQIEERLRHQGVPGMSVEHVRGYGKARNLFRRDRMRDNARLVIFSSDARADSIIRLVAESTQALGADAGILTVERLDRVIDLNDGKEVDATEL